MKIFIDAGHGGSDPGAVGNGLREKDLTLNISLKEKKLFERLGHEVRMSRVSDKTLSLGARTREANSWGADIFISNHINAGGGEGEEVWCSIYGGKGHEYAERVERYLSRIFKSRGIKTRRGRYGDYLYVIRNTSMPAILCEFGFIDNKNDTEKLKQESMLQRCAEAVVYGVLGRSLPENQEDVEEKKPVQPVQPLIPKLTRLLRYKTPMMTGEDIKLVQKKLNEFNFNAGYADGIFGRITERAVKNYQKSKDLVVDGIVGNNTWKKLFG